MLELVTAAMGNWFPPWVFSPSSGQTRRPRQRQYQGNEVEETQLPGGLHHQSPSRRRGHELGPFSKGTGYESVDRGRESMKDSAAPRARTGQGATRTPKQGQIDQTLWEEHVTGAVGDLSSRGAAGHGSAVEGPGA